jgi:hypothetical protein
VYNTILKSRDWLMVNCVVNAIGTSLPRFYIFRGKRIRDDYIQHYKPITYMVMQLKTWMITFLSRSFCLFQKVNTKWNIPYQYKFIHLRWTWIPCHLIGNWISTRVWVQYDHFTFTYIPCTLTFRCGLLQTFQDHFRKRKKHING